MFCEADQFSSTCGRRSSFRRKSIAALSVQCSEMGPPPLPTIAFGTPNHCERTPAHDPTPCVVGARIWRRPTAPGTAPGWASLRSRRARARGRPARARRAARSCPVADRTRCAARWPVAGGHRPRTRAWTMGGTSPAWAPSLGFYPLKWRSAPAPERDCGRTTGLRLSKRV